MIAEDGKKSLIWLLCCCCFAGLGQNALGLTLGTAAVPVTTINEGLGGIDFSSSSDKKSKGFFYTLPLCKVYENNF